VWPSGQSLKSYVASCGLKLAIPGLASLLSQCLEIAHNLLHAHIYSQSTTTFLPQNYVSSCSSKTSYQNILLNNIISNTAMHIPQGKCSSQESKPLVIQSAANQLLHWLLKPDHTEANCSCTRIVNFITKARAEKYGT
jgi:hypothetical protein